MPLFDFDQEWDWNEFITAVPRGIPFIGKWYGRGQSLSKGNFLSAVNPFSGFWNMSEEELAANLIVNAYGSYLIGNSLWFALNFYEDYRAVKFLTSSTMVPLALVAATAAAAHHNLTSPAPPGYSDQSWFRSVSQALVGGFGTGTADVGIN